MQETTAGPAHGGTGSVTIADIVSLAAERYGERPAARFKRDDEWREVSYTELGETVSEIARGLVDLGLQQGDRVALLCTTRVEWTYADFAITSAGGVVVPIYPTNSPEECAWVAGNSESPLHRLRGRRAGGEDRRRAAPAAQARGDRRHRAGARGHDLRRGAARARPIARARRDRGAHRRHQARGPVHDHLHVGDDRPAQGLRADPRQLSLGHRMCEEINVIEPGEVVYLFLPLAHSYALLIQLLAVDLGAPIAYWSGDPQQIVPDLMATKPAYLPSVPRIFEKIYTLVTSNNDPEKIKAATQLGLKVRRMREAGQDVPPPLAEAFEKADAELFVNVRNIFGGNLTQATSGAAPIAHRDPRVLLRLRRARARGLRDDGDLDGLHHLDGRRPPARHRRAGASGRRDQDRRRRRDPRARPAHLPRLLRQGRHDGLRRGDRRRLAAHG